MKQFSAFTKAVLIIIILHLFFLFPACGKKGDPVPPEQPKAKAGVERLERPAGQVPAQ